MEEPQDRRRAVDLLRLIAASGKAERFALLEIVPRRPSKYLVPLDQLLDALFVERVADGVGRWHYRLTEAGARAAAEKVVVLPRPVVTRGTPDYPREYRPGLTPRQRWGNEHTG